MSQSFRSPAKIARRMRLLPEVARHVRNWPSFMFNYAVGRVPSRPYRFRNGARLHIGRGVDHAPIIEVFLRRDYGDVPEGAVIVDLGASLGVFSIYAAATSQTSHIYAYEPLPEYCELMRRNVALNGRTRSIHCFNEAVAGGAEDREMYVSGTTFFFPTLIRPDLDGGTTKLRVPCTTLADILESNQLARVDLLKMDVEGAEYEILYGATSATLARIKEIRMEYHNLDDSDRNISRLTQRLADCGYEITKTIVNTSNNGVVWAARRQDG